MSQGTMNISNEGGASFRADVNAMLQALASTSKGNSRPSTVYAGQLWLDDSTPSSTVWSLYLWDGAHDIKLGEFDSTTGYYMPFVNGVNLLTGTLPLTNKTIAGGSNTISGIDETMLSTSDITTLNATTSKHGFLKKLSGTSTDFMNGAGSWAAPVGGDPGSSIGSSGYQKFPSGLYLQWGTVSVSQAPSPQSLTFPMTFPTAVLNIQVTPRRSAGGGSGDIGYIDVTSRSTSGFSLEFAMDLDWQALGN
jgi:hypothetical protein